jgi:hypothetical protein
MLNLQFLDNTETEVPDKHLDMDFRMQVWLRNIDLGVTNI